MSILGVGKMPTVSARDAEYTGHRACRDCIQFEQPNGFIVTQGLKSHVGSPVSAQSAVR